jgi:hypothetical protein
MRTKFIVLFFLVSCSILTTQAQKFQFGVKAGANINQIEGQQLKQSFAFGYHAGVYGRIALSKTISIQPEVYYSQVNHDTATSFSALYQLSGAKAITFGYINIPVLLNVQTGKILSIQAGPSFGIVTNTNVSLLANGQDALRNGDFSVVAGLQAAFSNINVYARYQVGVASINDVPNQDKWKSQTIHIGLGLRIL